MSAGRVRQRVLVVSAEPIGARMAGPAIRAWHLAEALAADHDVELVSTVGAEARPARFPVSSASDDDLRRLERWCDVVVFQGGLLRTHPFFKESRKVLVADVYDPFHLENLEQTRGQPAEERDATVRHLVGVLNEQLERADFFLCASQRQRDFWLGSLTALGRVNPANYDEDETLSSLVAVVPFGIPAEPPVRRGAAIRGEVDGIGPDDKVVLWAGGVYNWLDPLTLVRAVERLRHRLPTVRLYFLGLQHPNPHIPKMQMAASLRDLAAGLGLVGTHVFFNEGWVEYERRADYLLEADVGASTHLDHVETAFSFRTRVLDYLWARLPVVTTAGDATADLVSAEGLGRVVPPGDPAAVEVALAELLTDPAAAGRCRQNAERLAPAFAWEAVAAPLVEFCRAPRRAPDLVARSFGGPTPPGTARWRQALEAAVRYSRNRSYRSKTPSQR